jgi:stage II sporulation protein D
MTAGGSGGDSGNAVPGRPGTDRSESVAGLRSARRLALVLAVALVSGFGGASSRAEEPTIRVLLLESSHALQVDAAGRRAGDRIEPDGSGLRVNGRREQRLELPGPGPYRIAGRRYRGAIEIDKGQAGLRVINELPVSAYVAGTLLGEVPESWGEAVLRAQAVAIRTYALHRRARAGTRAWDVEADTRGQVYLGLDGETAGAWSAVDATREQVLTWDGELILAAFHGTAGGRTASAEEVWGRAVPYLESVPVEGEELSPDTYWRVPIGADELGRTLASIGQPVGRVDHVAISERTPSGRCETLAIRGSGGRTEVSAIDLRRALGERRLRSTLFSVRNTADGFVFVGSGRGHGVGMSQWGARAMAERGANYRAILRRFYPGARLASIRGSATGLAAAGGSW